MGCGSSKAAPARDPQPTPPLSAEQPVPFTSPGVYFLKLFLFNYFYFSIFENYLFYFKTEDKVKIGVSSKRKIHQWFMSENQKHGS